MVITPKYDNDNVTLGYLNKVMNNETEKSNKKINEIPKSYNSPPVPPYYQNSILMLDGRIYKCIKSRLVGSFTISDWKLVISTNEIDEALKFIYDVNKLEYVDQVDGMIETFFQTIDPSTEWTTDIDKNKHVSDLWGIDLSTCYQYEKKATNPVTYGWKKVNVPTSLFDTLDGYRRIFTAEPFNYSKDDLWIGEITKIAINNSEVYNSSDWEERDDFIESSKTEQEEYHKIYLLPKITEINRQISSEIKKSVDEIILRVSKTYTTKTEVDKYIDDIKTGVAEEYTTKKEFNSQISLTSEQINAIVEKNTTQDNNIDLLNQEYSQLKLTSDSISASVSSIKSDVKDVNKKISETSANFEDFKDNEYIQSINNLQNQIDGAIQFWNGAEIPTLNNYPAMNWTTENDRINHQADIYTVIEDIDGEMKQGKSYRFDKVNGTWQWIELTDNELSAVQKLAQDAQKSADKARETADKNTKDIEGVTKRTASLELKDNEIEASVDTLKENVNDISTTNKTVSNKNSLYIEDALEENALEFRVKGKSKQTSYTGKNLFNYVDELISSIHGLTSTLNKDGSITTTGIPTQEYFSIVNSKDITNILEDNQVYSLNVDSAYSYLYFQVQGVRKDGTRQYYATTSSKQVQFLVDKSTFSTYSISVIVGTSANWGTSSRTITNRYMLCKETDTTFEPYVGGTSSPNPSYPQEINAIKGIENLFNYYKNFISNRYGLASVINDDGSITTIGKPAGNYIGIVGWQDITDKLENGEIYTLSQKNNNTKLYTQLRLTKTSDSSYTYISANNGPQNITINKSIYSKYEICLITTTTVNWGNDDLTITNKYMFCKGLYTASDNFVPYGNWLVEKITGNNILNLLKYRNANYTATSNGVRLTLLEDGTYTINGTATNGAINVWIAGAYSVNAKKIFTLKAGTYYLRGISLFHGINWITPINITYNGGIFTVTNDIDVTGIRCCQLIKNNSYDEIIKPILAKRTTTINYEPYKEQNVLINLKNNELCSNKDLSVRDELVVNETETFIEKKIGKIVLNGSEYYGLADSNQRIVTSSIYVPELSNVKINIVDSPTNLANALSENYIISTQSNTKPGSNTIGFSQWNNVIYIYFPADYTLAEFKSQLQANPVTIYYELATPEKIQLDKVDIPLYENINNLTLLEDLETDTSVKYLTNNVTNQMYATRSQLKIAENSIRTDINAKFKGYSTTTEMNNTIEQKITDSENAISLKVEQVDKKTTGSINEIKGSLELKISKDENDEIVSMLNASAKEINLKSNRFSLESDKTKIKKDGTVEFTGGTIGGFELTKNEFKTNISVTRNYTQNDLNKVQQYLLGQVTLTNDEIDYYDANGDGTINILDLLLIQKVISGTDSATVTGTFELNSSSSLKSLSFKDSDGKTTTSVGINGIGTKCISADTISVNDIRKKDGNPFFSSGCNLLSSIGSYITTDTLISYSGEYDLYIVIGKIASNDIGRVTAVVPSIAITQSGTSINIADNSGFVSGLFTVNSSNQVLFKHRARSGTGYIEQIFGVKL